MKSYFSLMSVLLASVLSSIFAIRVPVGGKSCNKDSSGVHLLLRFSQVERGKSHR